MMRGMFVMVMRVPFMQVAGRRALGHLMFDVYRLFWLRVLIVEMMQGMIWMQRLIGMLISRMCSRRNRLIRCLRWRGSRGMPPYLSVWLSGSGIACLGVWLSDGRIARWSHLRRTLHAWDTAHARRSLRHWSAR